VRKRCPFDLAVVFLPLTRIGITFNSHPVSMSMLSHTRDSISQFGLAVLSSLRMCVLPSVQASVAYKKLTQACLIRLQQAMFYKSCVTKADYEEIGPSICRRFTLFGSAI
jgi:hypothetical protein